MANDYTDIKRRLREYLYKRGVQINDKKKPPLLRCPNPSHTDNTPSAVLYENQDIPMVHCPVCDESWSIFEVAGMLDGVNEFPDKLEAVTKTLGMAMPENRDYNPPAKKHKKESPKSKSIALPIEKAREIYDIDFILNKGIQNNYGTQITGSWKYLDYEGNVIALDVRYEGGEKKKEVITWHYDGSLKWFGAPIVIYNLFSAINSTLPVLIVEGAKCVESANILSSFSVVSWNGGSGKAGMADWSVFSNREIYILPDDDREKYGEKHESAGQLKPIEQQPGYKAAISIKQQLPHAKIIKPVIKAREIKDHGADVVEILQVMTPDELTAYIFNSKNHYSDEPEEIDEPIEPERVQKENSHSPFRILGIGDDGKANFITEAGRFKTYALESINKSSLTVLAGLYYWSSEYRGKKSVEWEEAIDDVIRMSEVKDFNAECIRGRGAWHDGEKLSYHDGVSTYGEFDESKIYLRLPRQDIGITDKPASDELLSKTKDAIFKLSFETPADAVRCMGWTILAPFAGALKHRPAILITGRSGSGKSTVTNHFIRKIANCLWLNGAESTVAGVRGKVKQDSCAIMFDELEADTEKKKMNRDELFSLMRVNVTDDSPDTVKGTKEQGYNSYKMQNMFGFIAIDPTIAAIADENRIFRINMGMPKGDNWKSIEKELDELLGDENNCRAIRALGWKRLKTIFALADRIVTVIREKTGKDYRSSYADALLASAFMAVWTNTECPTDEQINETLDKYYKLQPPEETRDEAEELVDEIMDETIEVLLPEGRTKISIIECMNRIYHRAMSIETDAGDHSEEIGAKSLTIYKNTLASYGMAVKRNGDIAFANNHAKLKQLLRKETGYSRLLKRHSNLVSASDPVTFPGGISKRCTTITGIIKKDFDDMSIEEKLLQVF